MAKLYFRHGTVGSAKTLNLLAVAHNYRQQGKRALLLKSSVDTRFGEGVVRSRAGLEEEADIVIKDDKPIERRLLRGVHCILVDEAQFLSPLVVEDLRAITYDLGVPVICYGLRTDFKTKLFPGSQRLIELADSIEEIKTTCAFCNKKAVFNLKHLNGKACLEGPSVDLGAEEKYLPTCAACYEKELIASGSLSYPKASNG